MGRGDGNFSLPVVPGSFVELPGSVLDELGVESLTGVATIIDVPVLEPLESVDETGAKVAGMRSAMNLNLYDDNGQPLNVSGLKEPIALGLPVNDSRSVCVFWDEEKLQWSFGDLRSGFKNESHLEGWTCYTRHLTFFGAIIRGFLMAFQCAQLGLLNFAAMQELFKGQWFVSPFAVAYWFFLLTAAALMAGACVLDSLRKNEWSDEFFLIPRRERPVEATLSVGAAFSVRSSRTSTSSGTGSRRERLKEWVAGCMGDWGSNAWRDILDEICSRWFAYFGEIRDLCENIIGGLELPGRESDGKMLATISQKLMVSLVSNTARRQAATSLGYSMDLVSFVTDDELLGKQLFEAVTANPDPYTTRGRQLKAWLKLHEQVLGQIDRHWSHPGTWCSLPIASSRIFLMSNPLVCAFFHCAFMTRSQRVMVLICELLGAFMLAAVFFEASGSAVGKDADIEDCEGDGGIAEELGKLIAIAIGSLFISQLPVMIITSLRTRSFHNLDYEGCPKWEKRLRNWRVQDRLFWVASCLYSGFCAFFIALFLANVHAEDHGEFGTSAGLEVAQVALIIPVGMALFLPFVTTAIVSFAWYVHGGAREELLEKGRREKDDAEGNWHPLVIPI